MGTVYVSFIVNEKGEVEYIKVLLGVGPLLDNEAIRLIRLTSGHWEAGKQRKKTVKCRMTIPVKFSL